MTSGYCNLCIVVIDETAQRLVVASRAHAQVLTDGPVFRLGEVPPTGLEIEYSDVLLRQHGVTLSAPPDINADFAN